MGKGQQQQQRQQATGNQHGNDATKQQPNQPPIDTTAQTGNGRAAGEQFDHGTADSGNHDQSRAERTSEAVLAAQPVVIGSQSPVSQASPLGQAMLHELEEYIEGMNPRKPNSAANGRIHQVRFFRLITEIVNNLTTDFDTVFGQVLQRITDNDAGVFDRENVYRYFDNLGTVLSKEEVLVFRNLVNFLIKTAPPKSRQAVLAQINVDATINVDVLSEPGRQRLFAFYNL